MIRLGGGGEMSKDKMMDAIRDSFDGMRLASMLRDNVPGDQFREALLGCVNVALAQREAQEPVAWMFQHEETGLTECVDLQQIEWGFEKNNPRWQKICPLYTSPPPAQVPSEWVEVVRNLMRWMPVYPKSAEGIVGGHMSYDAAIDAARALLAKQEG
jgi:hypothetical protein